MNNYLSRKFFAAGLVAGLLILAACASTQTQKLASREHYSGFLSDYDNLKEITGANGLEYLRWMSPELTPGKYTSIYPQSIIFYPKLTTQELAGRDTLIQIRDYFNDAAKKELSAAGVLATGPGPGVAEVQLAITGVYISEEGVKALEVLPIGALLSIGQRAVGARDQIVQLVVESKVTDSQTGKLVSTAVYKGLGEDLDNDKTQLTLDDVKPVLDSWAKNMTAQSLRTISVKN